MTEPQTAAPARVRRLTDESAVQLGIGGAGLLALLAGIDVVALPISFGVAALLLATALLAAPLEPPHALLLGVTGWALADGFVLHAYGELRLGAGDLALAAIFGAAALVPAIVHRSRA